MWEQQGDLQAEGFILYVLIINCVTVLPPSLTVINLSEKMSHDWKGKLWSKTLRKADTQRMDVALGRSL